MSDQAVNQNWLADQVERSEQVDGLERRIWALDRQVWDLQNANQKLRMQLAEQANKLRAYELVESRLWKELTEKQANKPIRQSVVYPDGHIGPSLQPGDKKEAKGE